jgi:DNA polymerase-3 subunit epsilon
LLDAGILVDVYLAMTGGQRALALDMNGRGSEARNHGVAAPARAPGITLTVTTASADELQRHEAMLDLIHKSSGGKAVWRVQ